jgi:hypothetical protein
MAEQKQLLHLVFGGELAARRHEFRDLTKLDIVGIYPNYAAAHQAWKSKAQQTVDNALDALLHRAYAQAARSGNGTNAQQADALSFAVMWRKIRTSEGFRRVLGRSVAAYLKLVWKTQRVPRACRCSTIGSTAKCR